MSKFDIAIQYLRSSFGMMSANEEDKYRPDIEAAIRVLEAAGKVDIKALRMFLGWVASMWGETHPQVCQLKALFAALPDKEDE